MPSGASAILVAPIACVSRLGDKVNYRKEPPLAVHSITQIHTEYASGASHEHIARVKLLGQPGDYARSQIINAIYAGDQFYTYATPPARVHVTRCPHCLAGDYLTTSPDGTKRNNLLDLPRY
jgi:hypothetical protein